MMTFALGFALAIVRLALALAAAACLMVHAWPMALALFAIMLAIASATSQRRAAIPAAGDLDVDAIGDRVFERIAARVDARR